MKYLLYSIYLSFFFNCINLIANDYDCFSGPGSPAWGNIENILLIGEGDTIYLERDCPSELLLQLFLDKKATLIKGRTYEIRVTWGLCSNIALRSTKGSIWIDWNRDSLFTMDERIFYMDTVTTEAVTTIHSFEIPDNINVGETRMRVVQRSADVGVNFPACEFFTNGSAYDFTIFLEDTDESRPFTTIWNTENPGVTDSNEILIPGLGTEYLIEWEEVGDPDNFGTLNGFNQTIVQFPQPGFYKVNISGNFTRINFNDEGDRLKLVSIDQWGDIQWESMEYAFSGCENMVYNATDRPDLSGVINMKAMFRSCELFNGFIGDWEVSSVINMDSLLQNASIFNHPLNDWDVVNVESMTSMFNNATSFNKPFDRWDVSAVTFMNRMFSGATSFDQNLGMWELNGQNRLGQMFNNSGMSCENYDLTLIGWSENPNTPDNRTLGAENINYWQAEEARAKLINEKGWTIEGDSFEECNYFDCNIPTPTLSTKGLYPVCKGEEVLLKASVDEVEYTWFKDGQPLSGQHDQELVVTEAGFYSVIYTDDDNCESEESNALEVSFLDDTSSPVLLNGGDAVLRSTQPNCRGFAFWEAEIEVCGDLSEIEKRSLWRLDIHNTGQFDIISTQPRPDGSARNNLRIEEELPFGTHRVQWEIRDQHGNVVIEEQLLTLVDMNPPTPVCLHGISTNLSPNTGTITIPARVFDVNSWDDCTHKDDLHFTFSSDLSHTHHTWNCDDLDGEKEVTFTVEIWVTNKYGHQNHCVTYIKVQDNRDVCPYSGMLGPLARGSDSDVFKPSELMILEDSPQASAFLLHHNYPNPFINNTTIDFELPETGPVQLSIYNSYGGKLYHQSRVFLQGKNEWRIEAADLPNSGFYLYRLGFDGEFHPGRMMRIEN